MNDIIKNLNDLLENGISGTIISVATLFIFLLFLNTLANKYIDKKWKKHYYLARRIKKMVLYTIALFGILSQFKAISPMISALLASGGVLAVALGLASQEAASSMINGALIYIYKPYMIGDLIYVSEHNVKGTVLDIKLGHTVIETVEKTHVTIPNSVMNSAVIENISNVSNQKNNYLFIDIAYDSDMDKAISIIQEEAMAHPNFVDARSKEEKANNVPAVKVHCIDFKESAVAFRASIYSKDNASGFQMLSDLRMSIKKRFEKEGIEIPFPYRVIVNK